MIGCIDHRVLDDKWIVDGDSWIAIDKSTCFRWKSLDPKV